MKVWNIIKIKSVIGKWNEKRLDISTILTTFDEETAKRNFVGLSVNGEVSLDGTCVVFNYGATETIYRLVSSPLVLRDKDCTKDMDDLYCAYKELLVSRLKQWGEKEVSKTGDIVYRLDIAEMDFSATNYEENNEQEWRIAEIVLNQNSAGNFIDLIALGGEKRFSLIRTELRNIENLANFIDKLTKFMSNTKN